jgi:hypothetical protein
MLRRFIYLDTDALNQYVTALEGGRLTESKRRLLTKGEGTAGLDAKIANVSGGKSREDEHDQTRADTDEARFDRLLRAAEDNPDELSWIEVMQPDVDFAEANIGEIISWECDMYVPEFVQTLARSGELLPAMGAIQEMLPAAETLGLDMTGLPSTAEMAAMSGVLSTLNISLLVVGDDEDTDWQIAGRIVDEYLHGDIDGRARVVGKVSKIVQKGQWRPFATFPGMNLMSREQRRKLERQAPKEGEEDEYLAGPALMLDLLAIYR